MKPLIDTHPRTAPIVAGLLSLVIYLAISWPPSEDLPSTLGQASVVAAAVFFVTRHLSRRRETDQQQR